MAQADPGRRNVLRTLVIVLVGQVGCLTLLVILLSVVVGQWLDATFHTKPILTLAILIAGIPLSVLIMLVVARRTLKRLSDENKMKDEETS